MPNAREKYYYYCRVIAALNNIDTDIKEEYLKSHPSFAGEYRNSKSGNAKSPSIGFLIGCESMLKECSPESYKEINMNSEEDTMIYSLAV